MADPKPRLRFTGGRWEPLGGAVSASVPSATSLPFAEQAAFWRRKVNVPTARWQDVQREDHAQAFMVAGAARVDLLDDLRKAVDKAVLEGGTIETFRKDFDTIVARTGWDYRGGRNWRTRIIYETNLRSSYMAGRWQQIQAIKHRRPFLQYKHNDAVTHPRPQHKAWDGIILSVDDPWWTTHYCPNGYGCKCYTISLAPRDLEGMGKQGPDDAPTAVDDTEGLDPGFDYNVGMAAQSLPAAARLGAKAMTLPDTWRDQVLADAQRRPADSYANWPQTMARVAAGSAPASTTTYPVGFLSPAVAASAPVDTALLAVDDQVLHRALKDWPDAAEGLDTLPTWLTTPDAATHAGWDATLHAMVYARPLRDGRWLHLHFAKGQQAARPGAALPMLRLQRVAIHAATVAP